MKYKEFNSRGLTDEQVEEIAGCITQRVGRLVKPVDSYSEFDISSNLDKMTGRRLILKVNKTKSVRFAFNVWSSDKSDENGRLRLKAYLEDNGAASWSFQCDEIKLSLKLKKANPAYGNVVIFYPNEEAYKVNNFSGKDLFNNRENLAELAKAILKKLDDVNYFTFDCSGYRVADESSVEPEEEEEGSSELDGASHQAWLLSWNPNKWNEWNYHSLCQTTNSDNPFKEWWRCSNTHPKNGDEVYLYKAGSGPKGVMAHGCVIGESKNGKDVGQDEAYDYIYVSFDRILDVDKLIIPFDRLKEKIPNQTWASQSSGIAIKPECAEGLRALWNELFGKGQIKMMDKNLIYFGAPGTGKSFIINKEYKDGCWSSRERVTFHPDYSYANFVGSYKPYMKDAKEVAKQEITYAFVPGPFTRVLVNALRDPDGKHLLVIEEINRANTAAVFGDIFQLLDRGKNGESEYAISPSRDLAKFLREALKQEKKNDDDWWWLTTEKPQFSDDKIRELIRELKIPGNMYLWATMNSADQGVFPMDTAFKRRWSFEYVGIDDGNLKGNLAELWNVLRKAINDELIKLRVNEDKCMGPFFLAEDNLKDVDAFLKAFKSKVLMYLFEDAARQKRSNVFADGLVTLSKIFGAVNERKSVFKDGDIDKKLKEILTLKKDDQKKSTTEEQAEAGGGDSAQQKSQEPSL